MTARMGEVLSPQCVKCHTAHEHEKRVLRMELEKARGERDQYHEALTRLLAFHENLPHYEDLVRTLDLPE